MDNNGDFGALKYTEYMAYLVIHSMFEHQQHFSVMVIKNKIEIKAFWFKVEQVLVHSKP